MVCCASICALLSLSACRDKPDAVKSRAELESEWEWQWEELVSESEKKHYFYCRTSAKSTWTIPHARQIKFIAGSDLQKQWVAEMRKLGLDPSDKPAPPPPQPAAAKGIEAKAASMLSAVKNAVSSAVSAVSSASSALRSRSDSGSGRTAFNLHPPQSPFLLTAGSANVHALAFASARHAGSEPTVWFEYLVTSLLSTCLESDLALLNPFLDDKQIAVLRNIVASVMFHTNRIGQINRCLLEAFDLLKLLKSLRSSASSSSSGGGVRAADSSLKQALVLKATTLASNLATKRHYLRESRRNEQNIPVFAYDPRYLVFEFSDNIVLRDTQVSLIDRFVQVTQVEGGSLCTQMIMGAGKVRHTTLPIC